MRGWNIAAAVLIVLSTFVRFSYLANKFSFFFMM